MIRVCIIGGGHIASTYYDALKCVPGIQLVAVVDTDDTKRSSVPHGIPFYSSFEAVPPDTADVAVVSVPQGQHYLVAMQAFYRGMDVLLEKPATDTEDQLTQLVAYAKEQGRLLMFSLHAAYGLEVRWFIANRNTHEKIVSLGPVVGFLSGFYDPHVTDNAVSPSGKTLRGSWLDSGVNALSVLHAIGLHSLTIIGHTEVRQNLALHAEQTTAHLQWVDEAAAWHQGQIDVSWCTGVNLKFTRLYFGSGESIVLHHSRESVILVSPDGSSETIACCRNDQPRLVNHYRGVFLELAERYRSRLGNSASAQPIHRLFFQVCGENSLAVTNQ